MVVVLNQTRKKISAVFVRKVVQKALGTMRGTVTVVFLTRRDMGKSDVLSFPLGKRVGFKLPPGTQDELGTIQVNADLLGSDLKPRLAHHLVHGTLHLLGRHHGSITAHKKIMQIEERMIKKITGYEFTHRT